MSLFVEHQVVRLRRTAGGVAAGTVGAVVMLYPSDPPAYEVEFNGDGPPALLTLPADDLEAVEPCIRTGTATDAPAIAAIQAGAPSSWRPEELLAYHLTVLDIGPVIGFAATRQVAPGEYELLEIAIHAAHRRQGHAERLLRYVLEERPGAWYLEVRQTNLAAQLLYQKLGFQAIGKRPNYYWNDALGKPEEGIVFGKQS